MEIILIIILAIINIPVYKYIKEWLFESDEEFREAFKFLITPDVFSLFKGRYLRDRIAEFKLGLLFFLCVITIAIEFYLIRSLFSMFI
ncbi:hypothetical protein [Alkaliphilus serpentinus]|uniref:Uncharacterized protein n=1 Tax=Alkaliphilus serpentinus TaxID=1482731 RepID=A0A833MEI7_9FIRM|nr:hypothetical protein [Alkaliphilus serpentinus]KAB3531399.1 hypothetical protein F8153_04265 [Alkaliphilus serpentinus]